MNSAAAHSTTPDILTSLVGFGPSSPFFPDYN